MSDLISRQDAIDILVGLKEGWIRDIAEGLLEILKIPPIEVEQKKGELKTIGFLTCQCSECGEQFHELEYTNFCPNCGARWSE